MKVVMGRKGKRGLLSVMSRPMFRHSPFYNVRDSNVSADIL